LVVIGLIGLVAVAGWAEEPEARPDAKPAAASKDKNNKPPALTLDKLKLPANAVLVVCDTVEEALRLVPKSVVLKPEKYQELMEQIADLERRLKPDRPASPSTCKLRVVGSMDEDLIAVKAEFKFKVEKAGVIGLGCQGAYPKKADLGGEEKLLQKGEDGFVAQVDVGEHTLTVDLEVPVTPRGTAALDGGADWGFKLDLPRAAVTTVELEQLPGQVKEVRCNDLVLRRAGKAVALGPVDHLDVAWRKPVSPLGSGPLLSERGVLMVSIEAKEIVTEARLTFQDQRGQTTHWILEAPLRSTVELLPLGDKESRVPAPTITTQAATRNRTVHVIQFAEPTTEPFQVKIEARQPRRDGRIPIGPFHLVDTKPKPAVRMSQQGTMLVQAPADVRLDFHWPGEAVLRVSQEEFTDEDRRKEPRAKFRYWNMPGQLRNPPARPVKSVPLFLELDLKTVKGVVETRMEHTVRLKKDGPGWEVEVVTQIHATPRRAGVDALDIQLPFPWPDYPPLLACWPRPGLPVNLLLATRPWEDSRNRTGHWPFPPRYELRSTLPVDAERRVHLLFGEKRDRAFTETITGVYKLAAGEHHAVLELPRPVNTLDRGGRVEVLVDKTAGGQELLVREDGPDVQASATQRYTFSSETAPTQVDFAWRPYLLDMPVTVETDITLLRDRVARLKQRVQLPATPEPPNRVAFRFREGLPLDALALKMIGATMKVTVGGEDLPEMPVRVTRAGLGPLGLKKLRQDRTITLAYDFPLPASEPVVVPLLWLDKATRIETRVRVWGEVGATSGTEATAEGPHWQTMRTEVVPRHDTLPLLVLRGFERDLPLTLRLHDSKLPPLATALVQRALIRAMAAEDGIQTYHARFLVSKWNTRELEVELPLPNSRLTMALLGGEVLKTEPAAGNAKGAGTEGGGTRYRLAVDPGRYPKAVVLDLHYQIGPEAADGDGSEQWGFLNRLRTRLYPPVLRGAVYLGRVRWQVELPSGRVVLNPGRDATNEETWGLRGWLLGPLPAQSLGELEGWLTGTKAKSTGEENEAALVCWQTTPGPMHLVHIAQKSWMLMCSVLLLALGLGMSFVPLSRGPFRVLCWTVAVVVGAGTIVTVVLWPSVLPLVVYGCEPGAAVLVVVLAVQWMLQRRYRRQLVFMPGFTRLKPGSALVRTGGGSSNRPREASTVDAPQTPDSSATRNPAP
jgi:hypothetical protein